MESFCAAAAGRELEEVEMQMQQLMRWASTTCERRRGGTNPMCGDPSQPRLRPRLHGILSLGESEEQLVKEVGPWSLSSRYDAAFCMLLLRLREFVVDGDGDERERDEPMSGRSSASRMSKDGIWVWTTGTGTRRKIPFVLLL
jgi:hypothetical protein